MFKKNTAVTGFGIGHFIGVADGIAVTTGTPTCKRTLDGTGGACANAAAYNTDGAVWTIDLTAGDMNADVVVLSFTLAGCIPISYTIKTDTKLVSDLNDAAAAPSASDNATATAAAILVTPANKLATSATGEASANVTLQAGVAVAAADAHGNVPVNVEMIDGVNIPTMFPAVANVLAWITQMVENLPSGVPDEDYYRWKDTALEAAPATSINGQDIADALLLAPVGVAAAGSAMDYLADIIEDTGTTLPGLIAVGGGGAGAIAFTVTVNDEDSNPVDGVEVWISTDSAGASVVAGTLSTDALGVATFMLDAGTYYLWRQRSGYNFANPVTIVVS